MRQATASLKAFLSQKLPFVQADLFTITMQDGTIFRWTSFDQPITDMAGHQWLAQGPLLERSHWKITNEPDVPQMDVKLNALNNDFNGGQNVKLALHNGLFDGATFLLQRAIMPALNDLSLGLVTLFTGHVGLCKINATGAIITINGANSVFNYYGPRNQYLIGCNKTLYDAACTLNRATYTFTNTVGASPAPTRSAITWGSAQSDFARFALGYIKMTSGAANGSLRTIKSTTSTGLVVAYPFYNAPAAGDTYSITYGCDKTQTTCALFSNSQNWRGFPYVPPAAMAF